MRKIITIMLAFLLATGSLLAQQSVDLIKNCQKITIKSSQGVIIEGLKIKIAKGTEILTASQLVANFDSVVLNISNARVVALPNSISDTLEFLFQSSFNGPAPMDYQFKLTGYLKTTHQFTPNELQSLVATSKTGEATIDCFEKMWALTTSLTPINCLQASSFFSVCTQTGIEETLGKTINISLYPNPFTDRLTIDYEGRENLSMKLFSINGVFIQDLHVGENKLEHLSSGIYLIISPYFIEKLIKN